MFERWERQRQILRGIELGTSSVKVAMGEILDDDTLSIVGVGKAPSLKVMKGEAYDASVVAQQAGRALAEAEKAAGIQVGRVFMATTGGHIRSLNSVGSTPLHGRTTISEDDIIQAVRNAREYVLPPEEKALHFLDRRYLLDGTRETSNPEGLVANKLEAEAHLIYGHHNRVESSCRIVTDVLGYAPAEVAFSGIAAAMATVTPEDAEKGVLVIDIGAGCTEYALFQGAGCFHSGQFTIGCDQVANDLSIGLNLSIQKARQVLQDLGGIGGTNTREDNTQGMIEVEGRTPGKDNRQLPVSAVERIVELRFEELFDIIREELNHSQVVDRIGGGICLTGGGTRIAGITKLARHKLGMPVRIAEPHLLSGDEHLVEAPEYMVPFGLIRLGQKMLDISAPQPMSFFDQLSHDIQRLKQVFRNAVNW